MRNEEAYIHCPVCGMAWQEAELAETVPVWDEDEDDAADDALWFCPACELSYETTGTFMPYSPTLDIIDALHRQRHPQHEEPPDA